jgi:hypothetical protein
MSARPVPPRADPRRGAPHGAGRPTGRAGRLAALALAAALAGCAAPREASTPGCPAADRVGQAELLGRWEVAFDGAPASGTMTLAPHPDFERAVRGTVRQRDARGSADAQVAGDADEGVFALDASADGKNITALWEGNVSAGSCGRKIEGTWTDTSNDTTRRFVLRKAGA